MHRDNERVHRVKALVSILNSEKGQLARLQSGNRGGGGKRATL